MLRIQWRVGAEPRAEVFRGATGEFNHESEQLRETWLLHLGSLKYGQICPSPPANRGSRKVKGTVKNRPEKARTGRGGNGAVGDGEAEGAEAEGGTEGMTDSRRTWSVGVFIALPVILLVVIGMGYCR